VRLVAITDPGGTVRIDPGN